jgi:hypothetical protein
MFLGKWTNPAARCRQRTRDKSPLIRWVGASMSLDRLAGKKVDFSNHPCHPFCWPCSKPIPTQGFVEGGKPPNALESPLSSLFLWSFSLNAPSTSSTTSQDRYQKLLFIPSSGPGCSNTPYRQSHTLYETHTTKAPPSFLNQTGCVPLAITFPATEHHRPAEHHYLPYIFTS